MSTRYICILGAGPGTGNLGVTALMYSAVALLQNAQMDTEVTILDYDVANQTSQETFAGKSVPLHGVRLRFSKKLWQPDHVAFLLVVALLTRPLPASLRQRLRARNRCLRHLQQAELVASLAGGDSFSDLYGFRRFIYVLLPQLLALACSRPLVLLPQSIGPFRGRLARALAAFVQKSARKVYTREQFVDKCSAQIVPQFCYDLAFTLEPALPPSFTNPAAGAAPIGLNVSGLLWMGGYTRNNMFGLKTDYAALVEHIAEALLTHTQQPLLLLSHTIGDDLESDASACRALHAILQARWPARVSVAPVYADPRHIKHVIGQCDFLVASRMHACIAALSQCIPAVALAYSPKFSGVLGSIHVNALVVDPCALPEHEVISGIIQIYARRKSWRRQLQSIMPRINQEIHHNIARVLDPAPELGC